MRPSSPAACRRRARRGYRAARAAVPAPGGAAPSPASTGTTRVPSRPRMASVTSSSISVKPRLRALRSLIAAARAAPESARRAPAAAPCYGCGRRRHRRAAARPAPVAAPSLARRMLRHGRGAAAVGAGSAGAGRAGTRASAPAVGMAALARGMSGRRRKLASVPAENSDALRFRTLHVRTRCGVIDSTISVFGCRRAGCRTGGPAIGQVAQARHLVAAAALFVVDQARQHLVFAILQLQHGRRLARADLVGDRARLWW